VANTYNNIGIVYRNKGDLENALLQHQRALEIRTRLVGSEHPEVATSYSNMAVVRGRQGHYEESARLFEEGHNICMKVYGYHHPQIAKSHVNKAWISIKTGNERECREHLSRALETGFLWTEVTFLKTEDAFEALRNTAWFQDLLQNAEKRH